MSLEFHKAHDAQRDTVYLLQYTTLRRGQIGRVLRQQGGAASYRLSE